MQLLHLRPTAIAFDADHYCIWGQSLHLRPLITSVASVGYYQYVSHCVIALWLNLCLCLHGTGLEPFQAELYWKLFTMESFGTRSGVYMEPLWNWSHFNIAQCCHFSFIQSLNLSKILMVSNIAFNCDHMHYCQS